MGVTFHPRLYLLVPLLWGSLLATVIHSCLAAIPQVRLLALVELPGPVQGFQLVILVQQHYLPREQLLLRRVRAALVAILQLPRLLEEVTLGHSSIYFKPNLNKV